MLIQIENVLNKLYTHSAIQKMH